MQHWLLLFGVIKNIMLFLKVTLTNVIIVNEIISIKKY